MWSTIPRRRDRREQLPGVGGRWHCRRHAAAAAAAPLDGLWSVCHCCRGARAISTIIFFSSFRSPSDFIRPRRATSSRPSTVRSRSPIVSSSSSSSCLPVAYTKSFRVSRSGVFVLFFCTISLPSFSLILTSPRVHWSFRLPFRNKWCPVLPNDGRTTGELLAVSTT